MQLKPKQDPILKIGVQISKPSPFHAITAQVMQHKQLQPELVLHHVLSASHLSFNSPQYLDRPLESRLLDSVDFSPF